MYRATIAAYLETTLKKHIRSNSRNQIQGGPIRVLVLKHIVETEAGNLFFVGIADDLGARCRGRGGLEARCVSIRRAWLQSVQTPSFG